MFQQPVTRGDKVYSLCWNIVIFFYKLIINMVTFNIFLSVKLLEQLYDHRPAESGNTVL